MKYYINNKTEAKRVLALIDAGLKLSSPNTKALIFPVDGTTDFAFGVNTNEEQYLTADDLLNVFENEPEIAEGASPLRKD
tara:strand:+ start:351 stop:590 length:240 start_codon:yes stop_codon:yes gene_type:complete